MQKTILKNDWENLEKWQIYFCSHFTGREVTNILTFEKRAVKKSQKTLRLCHFWSCLRKWVFLTQNILIFTNFNDFLCWIMIVFWSMYHLGRFVYWEYFLFINRRHLSLAVNSCCVEFIAGTMKNGLVNERYEMNEKSKGKNIWILIWPMICLYHADTQS